MRPEVTNEIANLVYHILIGARTGHVAVTLARLYVARPPLQGHKLSSVLNVSSGQARNGYQTVTRVWM